MNKVTRDNIWRLNSWYRGARRTYTPILIEEATRDIKVYPEDKADLMHSAWFAPPQPIPGCFEFEGTNHNTRCFEPCHDFRHFPTFSCLSPKHPHSFTQPMTCFPFPFPHNLYLIFYPTFYLIFLFGHFGYQGQVRSIRFTRRLVSLGLLKEFYLLGSHRPFKPHCVHVGNRPLDLLRRGHLRGIQDLGQG